MKSSLDFKREQVLGYAENKSNGLSDFCQSFLISFVIGKYQKIIRLVPAKNQRHLLLKSLTLQVFGLLHDFGFT